ncbi:MAG: ABC transporter ATP-binding protein/permease [Planctomycetes bacterium]|nr:ABC transporter ATP-binding protein/permease [Planctomycetota bacterium]
MVLEGVSRRFGSGDLAVNALQGVDLRVERGSFVLVRGPSGSGKTTLLNLLGGLDAPSEGRVEVAGQELVALSDRALSRFRNRHVGYVFQAFYLEPQRSALDNVCLPLVLAGVPAPERRTRGEALLKRVGLESKFATPARDLSAGQRQRVALARALVTEPALLLADEPTANLDSQTSAEILELIRELHEGSDLTVILVTHEASLRYEGARELQVRDGLVAWSADDVGVSADESAPSEQPQATNLAPSSDSRQSWATASHLASLALQGLWTRPIRTALLALSVAVGIGTLAFLTALYSGLDQLLQRNLSEHREILQQRAALSERQAELLSTLPLSQLVVRARSGDVSAQEVERLRGLEGVQEVEAVAFLFPVFVGVRPKSLEIPGVRERDLRREILIPTTAFGVPLTYVTERDLLPGKRFRFAPPGKDRPPAAVVLPASLTTFLRSLKSPEMIDRFAEVMHARLKKAMKRSPRFKKRLLGELRKIPGVGAITDMALKLLIRTAMRNFLSQVDERNLPLSFELTLYPGVDEDSLSIPLEVVGYSSRTPGLGIAVPQPYLDEWHQRFQDETSGALTKLLSLGGKPSYAEVHLRTTGLAASKSLQAKLRGEGYEIESDLEAALAVEEELAAVGTEAARLIAEGQRVADLSQVLSRGALLFSLLLFTLAGTVIVNGLTLSVLEQRQRIGILRALGASRGEVLMVFLSEAGCVGFLGSVAGLAVAWLGLYLGAASLSAGLAGPAGQGSAAGIFELIPEQALVLLAVGTLFSLAAGLLPALRAAALQPVDALR